MNDRPRAAPIDLPPDVFRKLGHRLVDRVADLFSELPRMPITPGDSPSRIRELLGQGGLPREGGDPAEILERVTDLVLEHSLYNGHPRFLGYITGSPAPLGVLGELLAAAVNPNVGGWPLSPVATEMEAQCVRWIAELIGYPVDCGGLLVSGGNMANFIGFVAARHARAPWSVREHGTRGGDGGRLTVYASSQTHTWIHKAADMFGLGTNAIRWIETDEAGRMSMDALGTRIAADREAGDHPILVVGTAGSVSTGAVDPLHAIADLCEEEGLWFHADGAYGALAARVPGVPEDLPGLSRADSVAVDPHKWLYAPLEAGCALVRDVEALRTAFSYRPSYYRFEEAGEEGPVSFFEYGPQNSRGFRALKVWLGLRQAGLDGYLAMIGDDIALAGYLHEIAEGHPELEALTLGLSISTFRYVPPGVDATDPALTERLNALNEELLSRMQEGGEAFVSNAVIGDVYVLRACVVNFRTNRTELDRVAEITVRLGREVWAEMG